MGSELYATQQTQKDYFHTSNILATTQLLETYNLTQKDLQAGQVYWKIPTVAFNQNKEYFK